MTMKTKEQVSETTDTSDKILELMMDITTGNNTVDVPLFRDNEHELRLTVQKINEKTFFATVRDTSQSLEDDDSLNDPIYFNHSPKELDEQVINKLVLKCGNIIGENVNIKPNLGYAFLLIAEQYEDIFNYHDSFEFLYGKQTKETARKIFKTDPMAYFLEVLNSIHQGDDIEKEIMILAEFTAHVDNANTVPVFIKGSPGAGKSSLNNAVSKLIPPRFLLSITSLSSKALFYNMKGMTQDYIKLVCNDFFDSEVVAFVKDWADTTQESTLKHMTVINGEGVTLEIEGKRGLSITSADAMTNKQVNRRMYHLNPQEDEDHLKRTQRLIIKRSIEQDKEIVDKAIETANAVYDLIINDNFIVFNPWLDQINVRGYTPTRLKHILHLIMARTLIYRYKREEIMDGILLGTKEDVERVLELDNKLNYLQTSPLSFKAFDIVKYLPEWEYDKDKKENKRYGVTFKELSKMTGESRSTLWRWIFGKDDNLGLDVMEVVKAVQKNPEVEKSEWLLFKGSNIGDDHVRQYGKRGLITKEIDAETTLRHFIACSPGKLIRDDLMQERINNITLTTDEDVIEFLEMAKEEMLIDSEVEESLKNPIAENFINKIATDTSQPVERTSKKHENKQARLNLR